MQIVTQKDDQGNIIALHFLAETAKEEKDLETIRRKYISTKCVTEVADYTESTPTGDKQGKALLVKRV